jgi:hypothetical protein
MTTSGRRVPLHTGPAGPSALTLQAAPRAGDLITGCWVQTEAFEVEVPAHLVPVYLREIGAPDSVHQAWAEHQRQGLPWRERYAKHARISLAGLPAAAAASPASPASPAPPMALDVEIDATGPFRVGETLHFRVLRDGQPLAGQAVELRGDMSRLGLWRRTDAEGRASVPVPFAGRWVLRATDLRPVPERAGHRESRFVTHTFSVEPAVSSKAGASRGTDQPNSPSMPKARSANHSSATPTISTEPPISTAWR